MAMSLLYALLDVHDKDDIPVIEAKPEDKRTDNEKRALKYHRFQRKQQKEVQEALYDALYAIIEGGDVNKELNMAIGKALCNAITRNPQAYSQQDPGIQRLAEVLQPIVAEAVDDI